MTPGLLGIMSLYVSRSVSLTYPAQSKSHSVLLICFASLAVSRITSVSKTSPETTFSMEFVSLSISISMYVLGVFSTVLIYQNSGSNFQIRLTSLRCHRCISTVVYCVLLSEFCIRSGFLSRFDFHFACIEGPFSKMVAKFFAV